ncbi:MAG TPA: prolipoprotein diacylglyceryl transferase [Mycobacterium sp.]|nr:MAG: diacylglyceryl transferase [Mycobacterium sp.]HOB49269.1 prolipoprotein diacylglyceryl transferase [Mycobacterium sp.]HQE15890.1 prolipoprotein diacylglyceryl transferase [Mycobacterium sp.]
MTAISNLRPDAVHAIFVALGILTAAVVFIIEARRRGTTDERVLYVVTGALLGGALFMRLGTWLQHIHLPDNAPLVEHWLYGNRSILGGLFGAWLGVHVTKRLVGYRARTGDLFAPAVALGMTVGRVGCLLTEAPGTPTGTGWGVTLDPERAAILGVPAGVGLHPSFAYEILFHLAAFGVLWFWARHQNLPPGETFVWYVAAYGTFRFWVEFVRGNEVVWSGLTRPQLVLAVAIPVVAARIFLQWKRGKYSGVRRTTPSPDPSGIGS